jgi:N-carbamoylputrescine amidase
VFDSKVYFNTVEVIDADGKSLGVYRKSHIPDSPGYHEKWHFAPGDSGFRVFKTLYCTIGVGICWDQWFPETARCLSLLGAELLLFPTAIGSEPQDPTLDSSGHWRRCLQGHAAGNIVPVIASNRVGREESAKGDKAITFYGSSFMSDHTGRLVEDTGRYQETALIHSFNLTEIASYRSKWGVFRDRRPELYYPLSSLTGSVTELSKQMKGICMDKDDVSCQAALKSTGKSEQSRTECYPKADNTKLGS